MLDLKEFDDLSRTEAEEKLLADGYVRHEKSKYVFYIDGADYMVRVSDMADIAERFARVCKDNEDNAHLPTVYRHRRVSDDLHITLLERLKKETDLDTDKDSHIHKQRILRGIASIATGHFNTAADKKTVHEHHDVFVNLVIDDPSLIKALKKMVRPMERMLTENYPDGPFALYNEKRTSVWYRCNKEDEKAIDAFVYFESLIQTDDYEQSRRQLNIIRRRLDVDLPRAVVQQQKNLPN